MTNRHNPQQLDILVEKLRWLRLPGMAAAVKDLLERAAKDNRTPCAVVDCLCDSEKHNRIRSSIERRIKDARFPEINTVDAFDFDPARERLRDRYLALHDLHFLAKGTTPRSASSSLRPRACSPVLHGADIHGSHDRALRRYVRADLLAVDDFAVLAMDPAQAKLAFQVIPERFHRRRATLITTNRPLKDWTKVFADPLNAEAIAKRLTERAESFILDGKATSRTVSEPPSACPGRKPAAPPRRRPSSVQALRHPSGRRAGHGFVSAPPGGRLVPGDPGETGTLGPRQRQPRAQRHWRRRLHGCRRFSDCIHPDNTLGPAPCWLTGFSHGCPGSLRAVP